MCNALEKLAVAAPGGLRPRLRPLDYLGPQVSAAHPVHVHDLSPLVTLQSAVVEHGNALIMIGC
jgi:hypothetical protein